MAQTVLDTVGSGSLADVPWPAQMQAIETGNYVTDVRKVGAVLGWQPTTALADGLAATWSELALTLTGSG
jgi:nucleoside-diphosphate-sugar epimerase